MSNYWRSFTELFHKSDFQEQNAGEKRSPLEESEVTGVNRRQFLGALSASAAVLATSCKNYRDEGELVPYNKQAEDSIPGQDVYYASSVALEGHSRSVLVRTRDGRPLKINGNPQHPLAAGKIDSQAQALIMSLYEPDRLQTPLYKNSKSTWAEADAALLKSLANTEQEIALISGLQTSPTLLALIAELSAKNPKIKLYSADPSGKSLSYAKHKAATGLDFLPYVALDQAKVILAVESDFLGADSLSESKRLYGQSRSVVDNGQLSKLYAIEGHYSATGMNADERIRLRQDKHAILLGALLVDLSKTVAGIQLPAAVASLTLEKVAKDLDLEIGVLRQLSKDLAASTGRAVVLAGPSQSQAVHDLTAALNKALGAYGNILKSQYAWKPLAPVASTEELKQLAAQISSGKVATVLSFGINPAYHLESLGFAKALASHPNYFCFANLADESAQIATWAMPQSHALEAWGDHGDRLGLISLQQPMIAPIFNARQVEDYLVASLQNVPFADTLYRNYLKNRWQTKVATNPILGADFWNLSLHDGFAAVSSQNAIEPQLAWNNSNNLSPVNGLLLNLRASQNLGDGELAHVGWLQELPHPVTKVTWDNYAAISPAMAEKLGFRLFPERSKWSYDMATLELNGQKIDVVVLPQPGLADDLVVLELGYGRTKAGEVGSDVGVSAYKLRSSFEELSFANLKLTKNGALYDLAITQENNAIDEVQMSEPAILAERLKDAHIRRGIIREGTYKEFLTNPNFLHEDAEEDFHSFDRPHQYPGVKWAMAIDLNKCIGCGECVTSCNVENNIPIVGKDMVFFGREMHWLRIDRYYAGSSKDPVASVQPMLCQHCDNAPCENVCPVAATAHSPEGLNDIAYNRCVGTRYCANTCAYKVRRFNYYNYRDHFAAEHQEKPVFNLLHNPEVTVRSRGVIEKCSFCVQRINLGRAESKRSGSKWDGSTVVSACQEACPTGAIAFGNINDAKSLVRKRKEHKLTYRVLAETGTAPNIHYQAKLRNIEEAKA